MKGHVHVCVPVTLKTVLINVILFSLRSLENTAENTIHLSAADMAENNGDAEVRLGKTQQSEV